jgi:glutathione S-transferase
VTAFVFERRREAGQQSVEWLARQRRKIDGGVKELARLIGSRRFAVGDAFGHGDIAVGTVLGYLSVRFSELDWQKLYPNLDEYLAPLSQRPSFASTIPVPQTISDKVV